MTFEIDVAVVGGCGHAGLPLGLAFAHRGRSVALYDTNPAAVQLVNSKQMPFEDLGADRVLHEVVEAGLLQATNDPGVIRRCENVIVVIGTPVDEHLNPKPGAVAKAVQDLGEFLTDGQLMILRSTVYPGVTASIERLLAGMGKSIEVAFCPERIAEGRAMTELFELPQIVAARSPKASDRAAKLYGALADQIVLLSPEEAELAKLFTNTWRYIKFATANQLYMIANDFGLDFEKIRQAVIFDYPRAADMPAAGFAAGPCLFKDTMQLAAFNNNNFMLGHAAMIVNEGLPMYVISRMEQQHNLAQSTVGILGMAFKAGSDDIRSSLSYKLKRILTFKGAKVLCTDPHVKSDSELVALDEVMSTADLLVVGAPHKEYGSLVPTVPVFDLWNLFGNGVRV